MLLVLGKSGGSSSERTIRVQHGRDGLMNGSISGSLERMAAGVNAQRLKLGQATTTKVGGPNRAHVIGHERIVKHESH
jgi:hypothetical protein